jgi:hypothetical protein
MHLEPLPTVVVVVVVVVRLAVVDKEPHRYGVTNTIRRPYRQPPQARQQQQLQPWPQPEVRFFIFILYTIPIFLLWCIYLLRDDDEEGWDQ